ncbi:PKD domain-containing protein [Halorussus lipolyticus]|uniref:PKD domain-containing protein n=1 Tax=Halorussus lipolyticus TaxID=3034024 RepID=UPI0023E79229|nr:PKD domain-containing protein [Halorussus sp. DT80]
MFRYFDTRRLPRWRALCQRASQVSASHVLLVGLVLVGVVVAGATPALGATTAQAENTCVSVGTYDADNDKHETTLLLEQIDGDFADIAETDDDSNPGDCLSEDLFHYYIFDAPPGEYHVHVRNDGEVNERWGVFERTVGSTDEETFALSRGGVYHTSAGVSSPRDSRRFQPGEDARFDSRVYNAESSGYNDVTTEVYVYPEGASRPDTPTKRLGTESVRSGRHEAISGSVPIPDDEGTYRVDVEFVTEFHEGASFTSDYVDLGTIRVQSFEPPEIGSRSPETGSVSLGPSKTESFSVSATDPDSTPSVTWYVDGDRMSSGSQYEFDAGQFGSGDHTVEAVVSDGTSSTDDATTEWSVDVAQAPEIVSVTPGSTETVPGKTVEFSAEGDSSGLAYDWTIDGETVSGRTVEATFDSTGEKQIQVVAENDRGVTDERSFTVSVEGTPPSIQDLSVSPSSVTAGEEVELSVSATDPEDRDVDLSYQWTIGGETYDGRSVSTALRTVGKRNVELSVTNQYGASVTRNRTVVVSNDDPELVRVSPEKVPTPETGTRQRFVVRATDADATPATVVWSVDGSSVKETDLSSTSQKVTFAHQFSTPGDHTVEATVEDGHGGSATATWDVSVNNRPPKVSGVAPESSSVSVLTGESMTFEAEASDPEGDATSLRWQVDGTKVGTGERLNHSFAEPGTRNVTVVADDGAGGRDRNSWSVRVRNFRKTPEIDSSATIETLTTNGSQEFITLSLRNPSVNTRKVNVELALSVPNGIVVTAGRNVAEGNRAEYVNEEVVSAGRQTSLSVGISVRDESLRGQRIEIPYQVIYYPEGSRDSYRVVENATKEIGIGDPSAFEDEETDSETKFDSVPGSEGGTPGFTPGVTVLALLACLLLVRASR